jgi:hypothetical protein
MTRDLDYENNNIAYDFQYPKEEGGGIKCKNYEICETVLPKWWYECKGHYLCINCHMSFGYYDAENTLTGKKYKHFGKGDGYLEIKDNIECPICLEIKRGIVQPRCEHFLCIECFKRCYYGDQNREGEPQFPYPEIEDEYYEDQRNTKWDIDYPLIKIHNEEWNEWDDKQIEKFNREKYLRKCSICRK